MVLFAAFHLCFSFTNENAAFNKKQLWNPYQTHISNIFLVSKRAFQLLKAETNGHLHVYHIRENRREREKERSTKREGDRRSLSSSASSASPPPDWVRSAYPFFFSLIFLFWFNLAVIIRNRFCFVFCVLIMWDVWVATLLSKSRELL